MGSIAYDDSILKTVNQLIGGEENGNHFDTDLIVATNSAIAVLTQLGVGLKEGFAVVDETAKWSDFIGTDPRLSMVTTYIYCKVKLIFDPPTGSTLKEVLENLCKELEWRAMIAADPVTDGGVDSG